MADRVTSRSMSRWFGNRGVNSKILLIVAVLGALSVLVGGIGLQKISSVQAEGHSLYTDNVSALTHTGSIDATFGDQRLLSALYVIATGAGERAKVRDELAAVQKDLVHETTVYRRGSADTKDLDAFVTAQRSWLALVTGPLWAAADRHDTGAFESLLEDKANPLADRVDTSFVKVIDAERAEARTHDATGAAAKRSATVTLIAFLLVGLAIGVALALFVARLIVGPLRKVSAVLTQVAAGDLTGHVDVDSGDELGVMARSVNSASEHLRSTVSTMAASAHALAAASEQLSTTSNQIASSAEETSAQAGVVASAAEHVSSNVQTVAAGTEEMGASIREIAQNAADAARVAAQAVMVASATNDTVGKLGESSNEIGNVIKVITSIASQTNLLALNATIEAARAGEAGKGFAVVANEVKDLAQETAKATEDISRRIEAIQSDTAGAVTAIGEISEVIARISDYQTTIAAAVEEQTATTNEMTRNVSDAATGSAQIAENVIGVATAAAMTTTGVGESQRAASDLARMSSELQALVGQFTY
jgi:methyl-accepting chemotaxis protein